MPPSASTAYNNLQSFTTARPQAQDYITKANDQYGVTGLNSAVQNLQSLVGNLQNSANAVAPSVAARTTGTFTTQGQRDALINREQQPVLANMQTQQQELGKQQTAQGQAESLANQMANTLMAQDQQKYQTLLDQYNAANAAEQFQKQQESQASQFAAQMALENQKLAEQQREFNLTPHGSGGSGLGNLASLFGGGAGGGPQGPQPAMQRRPGGGFNFQDASGKAISAATYAKLANIPFGNLLQTMANNGDTYAANAYHQLSKTTNQAAFNTALKAFQPLAWGYSG